MSCLYLFFFLYLFIFLFFIFFPDLYERDFIRNIDDVFRIRRSDFRHGPNRNNPSLAGSYSNRTAVSLPIAHTHVSSNSNNMTVVEPPVVQTSHTMPSINQDTQSDYHIDQYPGIHNNYMLARTPVFFQGSHISPPSQFIHNTNQFSAPVPCTAVPISNPYVPHVQTTSTCRLCTVESQLMLRPLFLYSDKAHTLPNTTNANASNVHGQYLMQSPQNVRPNWAPAIKQETECSHLAVYNTSE
jgi:hypothetical protein